MQKLLNSFSINKGAGGSTLMIDPLDETITSLRRRIEQFKKDHPELYESEIDDKEVNSAYWKTFHSLKNGSTLREEDEQRKSQQHTTREDFSKADEFKRALSSKKKSTTI